MLLLKLGCMVSGYHRKMYMTSAQLILAKTGQAPACIFSRAEGERKGCVGGEGEEVIKGEERFWRGCMDSLARASITRAKMYITI
jgi:hypothetical protein